MSEVAKLYEKAGIGKSMTCFFECSRKTCSVDCEHFEKLDMSYPPFTAEKQISLIIFLSYKYGKGLLINLRAMDKDIDIYMILNFLANVWQNWLTSYGKT